MSTIFNFYLDQKVTTWMRTDFEVEANSIDEAKMLAEEMYNRGDLDEVGWEEIDGTKEVLEPIENGNEPTAEIYLVTDDGSSDEIFSNKIN
jgi:hypothetical protein